MEINNSLTMKYIFSKYPVYITLLFVLVFSLINIPSNVISWDVFGYYLYLPAFFIYNDLGLSDTSWCYQILETYNNSGTFYQVALSPKDFYVINYSMGMSLSYLPFFGIAHLVAYFTDYPADGFSQPYQMALIIGNGFYISLGIICLRKVLVHFYSEIVSTIVIALVIFGTNFFQVSYANPGMSHMFLFSMYALLMWQTIRWKEKTNLKNTFLLGLICGWIILSRPTEIVCLFIPLLWGVDKISIKERFVFVKQNFMLFVVFILILFLAGLPQFIYWKTYAGSYFYNSYTNNGEGLDLFSPHTIDTLFSFRKGWLIYTPLMIFSIIGMYHLYKNKRSIFYSVIAFFIVNLYLVSSWSNWWYATSFSQRALMQSYAVLALPLGAFIVYLRNARKVIKLAGSGVLVLFVSLNLFQIWQMHHDIIDGSRMTKSYYLSTFGQIASPTLEQKKLLLIERSTTEVEKFNHQEDYEVVLTDIHDFENEHGFVFDNAHSGIKVFKLNIDKNFSGARHMRFEQLTDKDHAWIKLSAWVYPTENWNESNLSLVATFIHNGGNYSYKARNIDEMTTVIPNQWNKIEMDYLTPEVRLGTDSLATYFWLRGGGEIYIDDFKVEVFNRR